MIRPRGQKQERHRFCTKVNKSIPQKRWTGRREKQSLSSVQWWDNLGWKSAPINLENCCNFVQFTSTCVIFRTFIFCGWRWIFLWISQNLIALSVWILQFSADLQTCFTFVVQVKFAIEFEEENVEKIKFTQYYFSILEFPKKGQKSLEK